MSKKLIPALGLLLAFGVANAEDAELRYTYAEAGLFVQDVGEGEASGLLAEASWHVRDQMFLFARFLSGDVDDKDGNKLGSADSMLGGVGFRGELNDNADMTMIGGYGLVEVNEVGSTTDDSENFYMLGGQVRWAVLHWLEANGGVEYTDEGSEASGDYSYTLGAVFDIASWFSIAVDTEVGTSNPLRSLTGRIYFGGGDDD